MTKRGSRTLLWGHENRLAQVKVSNTVEESYLYDDAERLDEKGIGMDRFSSIPTPFYI